MKPASLRKIALDDGRYSPDALHFVFEALDHTVQTTGRTEKSETDRHISGQDLLRGMCDHAKGLFGPLAAQVWRSWGIRSTMDWGRVVFLLVEHGPLKRRDTDSIDDFKSDLDFDAFFVQGYEPELPSELGAQPTSDEG